MQTSINLQELFSYSIIPLILIIIIFILETIYLICIKVRKQNLVVKKQEEIRVIPERNSKDIPVIKNKYLKQLDEIEIKYKNNVIEIREVYQLISEAIRMFVFEVTDITTQNYSLKEIKKLSIINEWK